MLEQLKKEVYEANMDLVAKGMVIYTWGNEMCIRDRRHLQSFQNSIRVLC